MSKENIDPELSEQYVILEVMKTPIKQLEKKLTSSEIEKLL